MLERILERMRPCIEESIAKIDAAAIAIEAAIARIAEERMTEERLLNALKFDDTEGAVNPGCDSGMALLRRILERISAEKERLRTLQTRLYSLSVMNPGNSSFGVTFDTLSVHACELEETASLMASEPAELYNAVMDVLSGHVTPEIERVRDAVEDYRASAEEFSCACRASADVLRQAVNEFKAFAPGVLPSAMDFSEREKRSQRDVDVLLQNAYSGQIPVAPVVMSQAACPMPAAFPVPETNPSPQTGGSRRKAGFLGLFKRGKKGAANLTDTGAVPPPRMDSVQFSAIAANRVIPGKYLPVSIVMYEEEFRKAVDDIIHTHGKNAKEAKSGYHEVERNSLVRVVLSSRDIIIEDNEATQRWNGKYLNFEFAAKVPADFADDQILLSAAVYINDLLATKLKLILDCEKKRKHTISVSREDIVSAFVSYASQDRNRVAAIIQGMKKIRPDLDIFFDIESLRSGQRWEEALRSEIENRDILFLCWSNYARESKWVEMEWRYALESKGEDSIEPIPIESPDVCPPPVELQQKHFNDKMLFIIKATAPVKAGQPYLTRIKTQECMPIEKAVVRIGKDEKYVDIMIGGNAAVSRHHANIIFREGSFYIVDLNSTNRTYVDGQVIPSNVETPINHGSRISLANEEFEFVNAACAYQ